MLLKENLIEIMHNKFYLVDDILVRNLNIISSHSFYLLRNTGKRGCAKNSRPNLKWGMGKGITQNQA